MICRICGFSCQEVFKANVLNRYQISYYYCDRCSFLQTEEPYWLKEAYQEAISPFDTGILSRNLDLSRQTAGVISCLFDKQGKFLDYAGGYGILTRLMRDLGFDYYWFDLYAQNMFARGFEYHPGIGKIELITSFESFEHFSNPTEELERILNISRNLLFSTEILPAPVPQPQDWWYYGLDHGQHISFYSIKTIRYLAERYRLQLYTQGHLHLLTERKMNPWLFKLIVRISLIKLSKIALRNIKSKTVGDIQLIKDK